MQHNLFFCCCCFYTPVSVVGVGAGWGDVGWGGSAPLMVVVVCWPTELSTPTVRPPPPPPRAPPTCFGCELNLANTSTHVTDSVWITFPVPGLRLAQGLFLRLTSPVSLFTLTSDCTDKVRYGHLLNMIELVLHLYDA